MRNSLGPPQVQRLTLDLTSNSQLIRTIRNPHRVAWVTCLLGVVLGMMPGRQAIYAADASPLPGSSFHKRVANGLETGLFSYAGALVRNLSLSSPPGLVCSGTLIGCQTFITAAHCVTWWPVASAFAVYLDRVGLVPVERITIHPSYSESDPNHYFDMAVLRLAYPVNGVATVGLETTANPVPGTTATIVGYGTTHTNTSEYSIKRYGQMTLQNTLTCAGIVTENTLCWSFEDPIGPAGSDSNLCNKDSGSSLLAGGKLVGVNHAGGGADCGTPLARGYANTVYPQVAWIQSAAAPDTLGTFFCPTGTGMIDVRTTYVKRTLSGSSYSYWVDVKPGTHLLRFTLNGLDDGSAIDFNLSARARTHPTDTDFDCMPTRYGQFESCELRSPAPGGWWVTVEPVFGSGVFQSTLTEVGPDCSNLANTGKVCDDANPCTQGDTCGGGICAGIAEPAPSCSVAVKAQMKWKTDVDSTRDKLTFKWKGGPLTSGELGNPTENTGYTMCVYDAAGAVTSIAIPPRGDCDGNACWTSSGTGYKYKDRSAALNGVSNITVKGSSEPRASLIWKGKSIWLPNPAFGGPAPIVVQAHRNDADICVEATFNAEQIKQNDAEGFKGKTP